MVRGLVFGVWERIREGGEIPRLRTAIGGRVGSAVLRSIRLGTGGLRQEWFARRFFDYAPAGEWRNFVGWRSAQNDGCTGVAGRGNE